MGVPSLEEIFKEMDDMEKEAIDTKEPPVVEEDDEEDEENEDDEDEDLDEEEEDDFEERRQAESFEPDPNQLSLDIGFHDVILQASDDDELPPAPVEDMPDFIRKNLGFAA